jgi:hypothetical protein
MDRQARTRDTVLVRSREMTSQEPNTAVEAGEGEGYKDDRKQKHRPRARTLVLPIWRKQGVY